MVETYNIGARKNQDNMNKRTCRVINIVERGWVAFETQGVTRMAQRVGF
jgi:hypothetical protein